MDLTESNIVERRKQAGADLNRERMWLQEIRGR